MRWAVRARRRVRGKARWRRRSLATENAPEAPWARQIDGKVGKITYAHDVRHPQRQPCRHKIIKIQRKHQFYHLAQSTLNSQKSTNGDHKKQLDLNEEEHRFAKKRMDRAILQRMHIVGK